MVCFKVNVVFSKMAFESLVKVCFILSLSLILLSSHAFAFSDADSLSGIEGEQKQEQKQKQLNAASSLQMPLIQNVHYKNDNTSTLNSIDSEIGTEPNNMDNWITVNHDVYGSRES